MTGRRIAEFAALFAAGVLGAHAANASATNSCGLLSAAAVSQALHVAVVRVEPSEQDAQICEYSIKGKGSKAVADHSMAIANATGGQPMDAMQQKILQNFTSAIFANADADAEKNAKHPGEIAALTVELISSDAAMTMNMSRKTLAGGRPVTPIAGLGDEAFATAESMLFVRKGDRMVQFTYTGCACTDKDVVPLARVALASL